MMKLICFEDDGGVLIGIKICRCVAKHNVRGGREAINAEDYRRRVLSHSLFGRLIYSLS